MNRCLSFSIKAMRRPLAVFGLGFLAAQWLLIAAPLAGFLPAALFTLCVYFCKGRRGYPRLLLAAGLLALGLFGLYRALRVAPAERLSGGEYILRLEIAETDASYGDGLVQGEARVLLLDGARQNGLRVTFDALPECEAGDLVEGRFLLRGLERDAWRSSHYADGIFLRAEYEGGFARVGRWGGWQAAVRALRKALSANISRYIPKPYRGILRAMVTGDKTALSAGQRRLFRSAGLSHVLVVSGLHLGILSGFFGGRKNRYRFYRLRALLTLAFVLLLMAVSGFGPSVCRAGVAAILCQVGALLLLAPDAITSLGLAALLLGLKNPYAAGDIGLQLSVCATLGVLFSARAVCRFRAWNPARGIAQKLLDNAAGWVLPSLFAVLFTLPVQLWQGLAVSGVALLANLLTLWLVKPLLLCGLGCAVLGFIPLLWPMHRLLSFAGGLLAKGFCRIAETLVQLPFATLALHRGYALFVWTCLFLLGLWAWRVRCFGRFCLAAPGVLLVAMLCGGILSRDVVELSLVGSGYNPCAVVLQNGQALVLFRGGSANAQAISRYLELRGIGPPDLLIDLRAAPGTQPLAAQTTLLLEELPQNREQVQAFGEICLRLWNGEQGNLVLLSADGYTAAMASGSLQFGQEVVVDLLLAGPGAPGSLQPGAVLYTSVAYPWLDRLPQGCTRLYSHTGPTLRLRPGRSVTFEEVLHDP